MNSTTHLHNGDWYTDAECPCGSQAGKPVEETARDRAETDPCERGTPGCSVRHTGDSECQPW
jgi:hypothetical protein